MAQRVRLRLHCADSRKEMKQLTKHRMLWLFSPFIYLLLRKRPFESIANLLLAQAVVLASIALEPYLLALWLLAGLHARSARPFTFR